LIWDVLEKYREQIFGKKVVILNGAGVEFDDMLPDHPNGWGVLSFDASAEDLSAAIHAVSRGMIVLNHELLLRARAPRDEVNAVPSTMTGDRLTQRELEVFSLLSLGKQNKEIAYSLGISENTVKFHISSIFTKLHVTNRTEALRIGNQMGIISQ
jgi:DNA-binding NarL/FixJ family response regulator